MKIDSNVHIFRLQEKDVNTFSDLIRLFKLVFEMEEFKVPPDTHLKELLAKPEFMVLAVYYGNKLAGGLTAYELAGYYRINSEVFIYDIAIKSEFQRNGLGKQLLTYLKEICKKTNAADIFVAANEEDQHALKFYYANGGSSEKVIHFTFAGGN